MGPNGHDDETRRPLSIDELKIISEMVKSSLLDDLTKNTISDEDYYTDESAERPEERFAKFNDASSCPMCGSAIRGFERYTIEFGKNIRKQASLCGIDCLKQFVDELGYTRGLEKR